MSSPKDIELKSLSFLPLNADHFPLLRKWLNTPHVHRFWGENVLWTEEAVKEKYLHHPDGYQVVEGKKKDIYAFLILLEQNPIGYIQYYNVHDYPRKEGSIEKMLTEQGSLLLKLAGLDLYIGEESFIGKGIGTKAILSFLDEYIWNEYPACLVDPDKENLSAIRAYEKAGFKPLQTIGKELFMLCIKKDQKL